MELKRLLIFIIQSDNRAVHQVVLQFFISFTTPKPTGQVRHLYFVIEYKQERVKYFPMKTSPSSNILQPDCVFALLKNELHNKNKKKKKFNFHFDSFEQFRLMANTVEERRSRKSLSFRR